MSEIQFEYDIRIPQVLMDQLKAGEITGSMLTTMTILYSLANWRTGRVRYVSAGGLETLSQRAYCKKTYQESMQRLEKMGWITRHMTRSSKKDYPVTIHNYKWVCDDSCVEHKEEGAGKVHILNPKKLTICEEFPTRDHADGSGETLHETSGEGSGETSDKVLSLILSSNESKNEGANNNNRVVVAASASRKIDTLTATPKPTPTPAPLGVSQAQPEPEDAEPRVAGYRMSTIKDHVQQLLDCGNTWVEENYSEKALTREGFVSHVMTIEPTKPKRKYHAAGSAAHPDAPAYQKENLWDEPGAPKPFCFDCGDKPHNGPCPVPEQKPEPVLPKVDPEELIRSLNEGFGGQA